MAVAVIRGALLRVGEHLVGFAALFELFLGLRIPRVAIGMILHGELPVSGLQLLVVRIAADA